MTFLEDQFFREIGGRRKLRASCIIQTRRMLRKLVISPKRKFEKIPTIISNGQVYYDDGKIFLGHKGTSSLDCHSVRDGGRGSQKLSSALCPLYSIPLKPTIKDQVSSSSKEK